MANEHIKFLVESIDHLIRWEASESTSEMIPIRVGKEQDKIGKTWFRNIISSWGRHTPGE